MFGFPQIAFIKGWIIVPLPCSQYQDPESILAFTRKIKSSLRSHQLGEWEVILEVIHQGKKFLLKMYLDWLTVWEEAADIFYKVSVLQYSTDIIINPGQYEDFTFNIEKTLPSFDLLLEPKTVEISSLHKGTQCSSWSHSLTRRQAGVWAACTAPGLKCGMGS